VHQLFGDSAFPSAFFGHFCLNNLHLAVFAGLAVKIRHRAEASGWSSGVAARSR
jgi:hypothetical protein